MSELKDSSRQNPGNEHLERPPLLMRRLYKASQALAAASDETAVNHALRSFALSSKIDVMRLLVFSGTKKGRPSGIKTRQSWTRDSLSDEIRDTWLSFADDLLIELVQADRAFTCDNVDTSAGMDRSIRHLMGLVGIGSYSVLPLTADQRWMGALLIGRVARAGFSEELLYAWWTLAGQAAAALERSPLLDQTRRRSLQLQTAAEVSRAASSILDPDTLMEQAVELVRERFGLYYVGIFLVDETGEWTDEPGRWAVLRAGTGEAGRVQLEEGHKLEVGGESMIGWCVAHAQARISLDVEAETTRFVNPFLPETRSEMALPLVSHGQVIGAMTIQSTNDRAFSEGDISVLQTMADQLANGIQNARLFAEGAQRSEYLATLHLIASAVSRSLALDEMLDEALETVKKALGFDAGLVGLCDEVTGQLFLAAHQAVPESMIGLFEQRGFTGTICELVLQTGDTIGLGDLSQEAAIDVSALTRHGLHAYVGTPLIHQDRALGTLCLFGYSTRTLNSAQYALLEAIGRQIGVGVQNARFFEQTRTRAEQLSTLFEVSQQLARGPLQPEEIAEIVARRLFGMGNLECSLSLIDDDGETVQVLADLHVEETGSIRWETTYDTFCLSDYPATARVTRTLQPHVVQASDPEADAAELAYMRQHGVETLLIVPLSVKGEAIGVMEIERWEPYDYSVDELNLTMTLANQAAGALENTRLLERTQAALAETQGLAKELVVVNELAGALAANLRVREVFRGTFEGVSRLLKTTEFYIGLYDEERNEFKIEFSVTESQIDQEIRVIPADEGIVGYIIRNRTSVLIEENTLEWMEERGVTNIGQPAASLLAAPLIVSDKVLGVMAVQSYTTPRLFDEHDRDLLVAIANQTAIAIQNARLFEELSQRSEELATLNLIATTINRSLALHELLDEVLKAVTKALGFRAGLISLCDEVTGELYLASQRALPEPLIKLFGQQGFEGTLCDLVFQTGDTLGLGDLHQGAPIDVSRLIRHGLQAYAGTLLVYQNKRLGTLCLFHQSTRDLSDTQLSLLEAIGRQIGMGVESANLLEETQRRAHHEQILRRVVMTLNSSENLLTSLPDIAEQLRDLVPVDLLTLTSHSPGEKEFTLYAAHAEPDGGHSAHQGLRVSLEGSAAGWVITHDQPWLDTDLRQDQPFPADGQLVAQGLASRLLMPLRSGEQVIGAFNLASQEPAAYTEDHLPIMNQIADQIALALERARLLAETQQALEVVEATHRRYLQEEWQNTLNVQPDRRWGFLDGPEGLTPIDDSSVPEIRQALATGELVTLSDNDDGEEPSRRNAIALPIKLRGQIIGVLDFYDEERVWTEEDEALISILADQVSLALENARLFEKTQRDASRERLSGEIVAKIRAANDVQDILETAATELGRALGVSRARIRLGNPGIESSAGPEGASTSVDSTDQDQAETL